jgi:hypothetical protein
MQTIKQRVIASLLLTPAILLLLAWTARFAGAEEVANMGLTSFVLWSAGAAFAIAYLVTMYVEFVSNRPDQQ